MDKRQTPDAEENEDPSPSEARGSGQQSASGIAPPEAPAQRTEDQTPIGARGSGQPSASAMEHSEIPVQERAYPTLPQVAASSSITLSSVPSTSHLTDSRISQGLLVVSRPPPLGSLPPMGGLGSHRRVRVTIFQDTAMPVLSGLESLSLEDRSSPEDDGGHETPDPQAILNATVGFLPPISNLFWRPPPSESASPQFRFASDSCSSEENDQSLDEIMQETNKSTDLQLSAADCTRMEEETSDVESLCDKCISIRLDPVEVSCEEFDTWNQTRSTGNDGKQAYLLHTESSEKVQEPASSRSASSQIKESSEVAAAGEAESSEIGAAESSEIAAAGAAVSSEIAAAGAAVSSEIAAAGAAVSSEIAAAGAAVSSEIAAAGATVSSEIAAAGAAVSSEIAAAGADGTYKYSVRPKKKQSPKKLWRKMVSSEDTSEEETRKTKPRSLMKKQSPKKLRRKMVSSEDTSEEETQKTKPRSLMKKPSPKKFRKTQLSDEDIPEKETQAEKPRSLTKSSQKKLRRKRETPKEVMPGKEADKPKEEIQESVEESCEQETLRPSEYEAQDSDDELGKPSPPKKKRQD